MPFGFGRKTHSTTTTTTTTGDQPRKRKAGLAGRITGKLLLSLALIGWAAAWTMLLIATAVEQHKLNDLNLRNAAQTATYAELYQSGLQIPYPNDSGHQLAFRWYFLAIEFVTWLLLVMVLLFSLRFFWRLKYVALALTVYVFVLATYETRTENFFRRNALAKSIFDKDTVYTTFAGVLSLAAFNGLTLIFAGLLATSRSWDHHDARHPERRFEQNKYGAEPLVGTTDTGYGAPTSTVGTTGAAPITGTGTGSSYTPAANRIGHVNETRYATAV